MALRAAQPAAGRGTRPGEDSAAREGQQGEASGGKKWGGASHFESPCLTADLKRTFTALATHWRLAYNQSLLGVSEIGLA